MKMAMGTMCQQLKIFVAIVERIAIAVMDIFRGQKFSTHPLFDHMTMFVWPAASFRDFDLPVMDSGSGRVQASGAKRDSARMFQAMMGFASHGMLARIGRRAIDASMSITFESSIRTEIQPAWITATAWTETNFDRFESHYACKE